MPRIDLKDLEYLSEDEQEGFKDRREQKRSKEFKQLRKRDIYYDE